MSAFQVIEGGWGGGSEIPGRLNQEKARTDTEKPSCKPSDIYTQT